MYKNDKIFINTYNNVFDFNSQLWNYVINSGQLNLDESMIGLYANYEINLRRLFKELDLCIAKNDKNNFCIQQFKTDFEKLRSDTSKLINK
jgi:hypothetical protein